LQFGFQPHVPESIYGEGAKQKKEIFDPELALLPEEELIARGVIALQSAYSNLEK
jgi:hypothetical protein